MIMTADDDDMAAGAWAPAAGDPQQQPSGWCCSPPHAAASSGRRSLTGSEKSGATAVAGAFAGEREREEVVSAPPRAGRALTHMVGLDFGSSTAELAAAAAWLDAAEAGVRAAAAWPRPMTVRWSRGGHVACGRAPRARCRDGAARSRCT